MLRSNRFTTILLLCTIAVPCMAMMLADGLQDTKWKIKVTPDEDARGSGGKEFDDVLIFKGPNFTSQALAKQGFKPVVYDDDTRRFGPASFTATPESDKGDKAKWTGTVTATAIKGELVWTKKDGKVLSYTYTGERDDSR